jgi:hypothetical protein
MAGMEWFTPELLVLGSGAEADQPSPPDGAAGKHQAVTEGVGDSCEGIPGQGGIGCPGGILVGPS